MNADLMGAVVAHVIFISSIAVFAARMAFGVDQGHWIGVPLLLMAAPLTYLLIKAPEAHRPPLYYVQVGLMLGWIVLIFILDYLLALDWRSARWSTVTVVTLYFAALGGMIGVSALAGPRWTTSAVILFFVALILAFVQRRVTGL